MYLNFVLMNVFDSSYNVGKKEMAIESNIFLYSNETSSGHHEGKGKENSLDDVQNNYGTKQKSAE